MKKLLLLVFSLTLVLFFNPDSFAQRGDQVKVANNMELIQALDDPSVSSIEITQDGFYDAILSNAGSGTIIQKDNISDRGVNDIECNYAFNTSNICFPLTNTAKCTTYYSGTGDTTSWCAPSDDGLWEYVSGPLGGTLTFDTPSMDTTTFTASIAGTYTVKHTWYNGTPADPSDDHIGTTIYEFYGSPEVINLEAAPEEVCSTLDVGWDTEITYEVDESATVLEWYVNDVLDASLPTDLSGTFTFHKDDCGDYDIQLVATNELGCGLGDSTITVSFFSLPEVEVGENDTVCGLYYAWEDGFPEIVLECGDEADLTKFWTTVSNPTPPGDVVYDGDVGVTVSDCGTYLFAYVVENGPCAVHDTIEVTFYDAPEIIEASDDREVCGLEVYLTPPTYTDVCGTELYGWTQTAKPVDAPDADITGNTILVEECGLYEFTYTVTIEEYSGICEVTDVVEVYFYDTPEVAAGDDAAFCGLTAILTGITDADCTNGEELVLEWSMISGPSGETATFDPEDADLSIVGVEVSECGVYEFQFKVVNGECADSAVVQYEFLSTPIADAGEDGDVCGFVYAGFDGSYDNTCTATGGEPVETWAYVVGSGPETDPDFTDPVFDLGEVTVTACGFYEFEYTVDNEGCDDSDIMSVFFYDVPVVNAGTNDSICGYGDLVTATLSGDYTVACTNGIQTTVLWTLLDGAGGTVTNTPDYTTLDVDVKVDNCGTYEFELAVTNGECIGYDTVTLNFYDTPVVDVITDVDLCDTYVYTFDNPTYTLECDNNAHLDSVWSVLSAPAGGNASFMGNVVTVTECGTYQLMYTVRNGSEDIEYSCNGSEIVYLRVYDQPFADAGDDLDVCGLESTLNGSYTLACDNGFDPTITWSKASGPGDVTFTDPADPTDPSEMDVAVTLCGTYEFEYIVENGLCSDTDTVVRSFFLEPEIYMVDSPEHVCGLESPEFMTYFTTCTENPDAVGVWTSNSVDAEVLEAISTDMFYAEALVCGTYEFTYTVTNGPCDHDTTITMIFYSAPEVEITPMDDPFACSTVEYTATDMADCADLGTRNFTWTIAGGLFLEGGLTTTTTNLNPATVIWDADFGLTGVLMVCVGIDELGEMQECVDCEEVEFDLQQPTIAGQVKYWNATETYMPTPFPTDEYGSAPEDYFYVNLYSTTAEEPGMYSDWGYVKVEPYLYEEGEVVYNYDSYYEFPIPTHMIGCDADLFVHIWDGGLNYLSVTPPPSWETYLGASYTYNNWGGVNATDALAIQIMTTGVEINGAPWNYNWIGLLADTPDYGYYSESIADVNNSGTITALDALIANYRAVGLLGSYPDAGSNQFNTNFRVTGRMVDGLDVITFPTPFVETAITDIPFNHDGADYEYFSEAEDQFYTSDYISWTGANNFMNIYYEAIGDVNASYVPTSDGFKTAANVELAYEGVLSSYVDQIVTIPVSIDRDAEIGAITLNFNYRNDLIEVIGTDFADENVFIDQENGILNIGWFSTDGIDVAAEASIAQIKVKVLAKIADGTELFQLNTNTEIADITANPIELELKAVAVTTDKGMLDATDLTSANYPNPFNDVTTIEYTLPENGTVTIEVYNNTGIRVATLVNEAQESGVQAVKFNANSVEAGMYYYHITVKGESNDYSAVKRMIVIR